MPFTITGGGAAEFGVDYTLVPSGLISAGTNSASFVVQAVLDDLDEEDEDFTITMTQAPNACGQTGSVTVGGVIQNVGSFDLLTENMVVECGNDSIPLVAIPTGGVSPISYVWEHDGSTDALGYGNAQYDLTYRVTAVDACGVTAVGEIFVDILCDLIIPNVFTPNGDGINDRWVIQGIEASRNTVRVLNRWGQVVFSSSNYRNNWNGSDLPDGTYFYEIIVDDKPYTGHVSILANGR